MRGAVIHAPGDIRFETLEDPKILRPTDAVIRTAVTCVCGSDLWPYRGLDATGEAHPMGHEYVGFVEETGSEVTSLRPGQFVVGSFATSDNTCADCRNGFQSNCLHREFMSTCQAEYIRIPNAQGTLVALDETPDEEFWPGLLALSDVMGTGWWAADAAEVKPGAPDGKNASVNAACCDEYRWSRLEEGLDRAALIHGPVALGDLLQGEGDDAGCGPCTRRGSPPPSVPTASPPTSAASPATPSHLPADPRRAARPVTTAPS